MGTLILIPTYNERDNIVRLVDQIIALPGDFEVLVVDDGSPDGTAAALTSKFGENPRVHLLQRGKKLGLGTAYTAGFRYAIDKGYRKCITMDADFSHEPGHIPSFDRAADEYDLVIGSRYIPGGSTVNWGFLRKALSRIANILAHNFLGLKPSDCTSGYRLYHIRTLEAVDFSSIAAEGYSYLVEILFRASSCHLKIGEVPITFLERREGRSKISRKEIIKAIQTMLRLRFSPYRKTDGVVVQV